jgi:hypothetical protein
VNIHIPKTLRINSEFFFGPAQPFELFWEMSALFSNVPRPNTAGTAAAAPANVASQVITKHVTVMSKF